MATEKDLTIQRGTEFNFCQRIVDPDSKVPVMGLTSTEIKAQIRLYPGAPVVAEFTPTEGTGGDYSLVLSYEDSLLLEEGMKYIYDVHYRHNSTVERASFGEIRVEHRSSNLAPA